MLIFCSYKTTTKLGKLVDLVIKSLTGEDRAAGQRRKQFQIRWKQPESVFMRNPEAGRAETGRLVQWKRARERRGEGMEQRSDVLRDRGLEVNRSKGRIPGKTERHCAVAAPRS